LIRRARGSGLARGGVILSSGSPRRKAILEQLGVDFRVEVPGVEELEAGEPRAVVVENALRKARALARPGELVLGADTAVVVDGELFGKPPDEPAARELLERMSGRAHEVMSGIAVCADGAERSGLAVTIVRFRGLTPDDVDWYLATGEWREHAGGYAIQKRGAALVESIEGDYWNVVGLPVPALLELVPDLLRG
jgi:nucleoside triphosphate pyrophosphatase